MEDRKLAVKKYNELKAKYGLPSLKEIESEFDFELEEDIGIAKIIINQIWERISSMRSYIEGILNPQRYNSIIETKFFNAKEKERVFNFYKLIMIEYWKTIKITYDTPEMRVKQIKNSYDFYQKVKKYSNIFVQRMIDGWSEKDKKEKEGYIN